MEVWEKNLPIAYDNYQTALEAKSSKTTKLLGVWETESNKALQQTVKINFTELASFKAVIYPDHLNLFFKLLKLKIISEEEKISYLFLIGDDEEAVSAALKKADILTLLTLIGSSNITSETNTIIRERPDILLELLSDKYCLLLGNLRQKNYFQDNNGNVSLLLAHFNKSEDIKEFSRKMGQGNYLQQGFLSNMSVQGKWKFLSDQELAKANNFKEMVNIYANASNNWQNNLDNFKIILKAMDGECLPSFLGQISFNHQETGFCYSAAVYMARTVLKKQIDSEIPLVLFSKAALLDFKISKLKKRIIKKYLSS